MSVELSLSKLNEHLPYGLVLISEDLKILYSNNKSKQLLRFSIENNRQIKFEDFNKYPDLYLFIEEAFSKNSNFSREFSLSEDQTIQVDSIFLEDINELTDKIFTNNKSLILCIYPVSHFKRSEKNQRQFVANVSHELKTPLTSILGYLETLLDDDELDANIQKKFLQIIQRQSQRLATIVSDLLTLSQLDREEAPENKDDMIRFNLVEVIKNSINSLAFKAQEKNIKISFEDNSRLQVPMEQGLMEQAIVNLVDNAIKFTPDNGKVDIKIKSITDYVEISVIDEGPGIPEKYHTRIFERFFSVDKGRSRKLGGSGLGLSIVKHIVLNHNGDIFIKNRTDKKGSIFTIHLPK